MRPGRALDIADAFEARFGQRPEGLYVVGSRAEAYTTGKWPEGSGPNTSDIDLVIQSDVPDVTKWTPEGFQFLRDINPGKVPPGITAVGVGPNEALIGSGPGAIPKAGLVDPFVGPAGELPDLSLGPAIKVYPLPPVPPALFSAAAGPLATVLWQWVRESTAQTVPLSQ